MAAPPLLVILGPTASGKSALALAVARRLNAEILSVDSMQVYRGMDIGTAKPSVPERLETPHHLIDVVTPAEEFAVSRFVTLADSCIADVYGHDRPLIATGGTPLYYKALFDGLFEGPGADAGIRERLGELTSEALHSEIKKVDAAAAIRIHVNDRKRLIRALEVYELTGQPISSFQHHWSSGERRHEAIWFGLQWEQPELNRRINARAKQMIDQGWVGEVQKLLSSDTPLGKTAKEATGYHELIEHLEGRLPLADAIEAIKIATRQLARRQIKWFRRFPGVIWLDGRLPLDEQVQSVLARVPAQGAR